MGDSRRFSLLADLMAAEFPDPRLDIADVASGKGGLRSALRRNGYDRVTCWDRRKGLAKGRTGQVYGLFDHARAPAGYGLVAAMHPDEATDHCVLYAVRHRVSFIVCPCCVRPSGAPYRGPRQGEPWRRHLAELAAPGSFRVREVVLRMRGGTAVLIGKPG